MAIPQGPKQRVRLDFESDAPSCGRWFRTLCGIDGFSRECLATILDTPLSDTRVAPELNRIPEIRGFPRTVVSDNRSELNSIAILNWQEKRRANGTRWTTHSSRDRSRRNIF